MELQLQCGSKAMLYGNKKITNVCKSTQSFEENNIQ